MKLLLECALGASSSYAPYLATLPVQPTGPQDEAAFMHPLLWPPSLASSLLHGSFMLPKLRKSLEQCRDDAACIRAALSDHPCGELATLPSDEDVRWAASMVLSRAFYLPGVDDDSDDAENESAVLALVPWADALNHSSHADERSVLQYDPEERCAVLFAHKCYAPGDQVFDSYSPGKAPVDTLLEYGFVEPRSTTAAVDRVDVPASCLGAMPESNEQLLSSVGLDPATAIASLSADGPDPGVLAWLRVASATPEELRTAGWSDLPSADINDRTRQVAYEVMGKFMASQGSRNESAALQRLQLALETQCTAYSTELEDDIARLDVMEAQSWSPGRQHAELTALRAIVSERTALQGSLDAVIAALRAQM